MADDAGHLGSTQRRHQAQRVAHIIQRAEFGEIGIKARGPAGGAAIAALVGRDDVVARSRQRQHDLAPGIGDLREAMQQQQQRPAGLAGLEQVHHQAPTIVEETGADAVRQGDRFEHLIRLHRPGALVERRGVCCPQK